MSKDRVAIVVGAKGIAGARHMAFWKSNGVNFLGTESPSTPAMLGAMVNLEVMLGRECIVSICSPDHTHADFAIAALEAGAHVICEKPLAQRTFDVVAVSRARHESGTRLSCNFPLRYDSR